MANTLLISAVICSYNRAGYIKDALQSLVNQTLDKTFYEVFVVDNNSTDNTRKICTDFINNHSGYNLFYKEEKQQGASFARNSGAAYCSSPLLCFMDDDAVAKNDYLEKIVSFFNTHSNVAGLGGRIIPKYIPTEPAWMSYHVSSLVGNFDYSDSIEAFKPGKYPLESNMVIFKKDFDSIGGFNTKLPGVVGTLRIGGEGKDFFYRLSNLGKPVYYSPDVVVWHVVEVQKLTREYMYRIASGIGRGERVRIKDKGIIGLLKKNLEYGYKLVGAIVLGLLYSVKGNPQKAMPVINFRIDAFKGLWGY